MKDQCEYGRTHIWVAGMMYVTEEDVEYVAELHPVECESCGIAFKEAVRTGRWVHPYA